MAIGGQIDVRRIAGFLQTGIDDLWLAVIDRFRKETDSGHERRVEVLAIARKARIGLAEGAGGERVRAEHEIRVLREPTVHADGVFVRCRWAHLVEIEPGEIAFRIADLALAKEQDVDDDDGTGAGAEAALGQAYPGDQVRRLGDMLARRCIRLIHRAQARHEGGERAGLQQIDRPCDEVVMQAQPHRPIRTIRAHSAIGERRIADGEIEVCRQLGAGEIARDDPRPRLQQTHDARRDRIEFDAGDVRGLAKSLRHQRRE